MAAAPQQPMAPAAPAAPTHPTAPHSVVKLRSPTVFTGDRTKTNRFILDVEMYLDVNNDMYDTNLKKIAFALSFMTGGSVDGWKEAKIQTYATT